MSYGIQWYVIMKVLPEGVASQPSGEDYNFMLHARVKEIVIPQRSITGTDDDFTFPNVERLSDDVGTARSRKLKKSKSDSSSARASKASKTSKSDDNIGPSSSSDQQSPVHSPIYEPRKYLRTGQLTIGNSIVLISQFQNLVFILPF
jgi:hypothetical protein